MDADRPVFRRMIEAATGPARPYDVILVHSLSRIFRDAMYAEMDVRCLRRLGVSVLSITQEFGADTTGDVVRKILNVFDEYQNRENAKHTHRAMVENARQGSGTASSPRSAIAWWRRAGRGRGPRRCSPSTRARRRWYAASSPSISARAA